jgi:SAM-dependent methyltransferase
MSDADPSGINRGVWERPEVVEFYRALELRPRGEEAILAKLASWLPGKRILDIGVGGGRTTRRLLELSRDYTGIDYSAAFAERAQRAFPGVRILHCDAREMSPFADASFDFVMFSLNGIDYVGHEDRLRILREVRRVLREGGYFSFSSHNRGHRHFGRLPWAEGLPHGWNDVKTWVRAALFLPRHWRMRRHEIHERDYAIVNDIAHDFTLMTYYIPVTSQVAQLSSQGFGEIEAYDLEGQPADGESTHAWIFYLARKQGA